MANPEHVAKLIEGAGTWKAWRRSELERTGQWEADLGSADLRRADLRTADLSGTNLKGAQLGGVDLESADLRQAQLHGATLTHANLGGADLRHANFSWANLSDADFRRAKLFGANLSYARLARTDLSGAELGHNILVFTDLSSARGLDTCRHLAPIAIDHQTLAKSGPLPLQFLRGCGLAEDLITYLLSLVNPSIQFYSCFISYSTKDQEFADRLHADLQNKGVRCWFAPHNIAGGKKMHEQIDEAIRVYDRLLLILSEHSMHSGWVETEISKARKRELKEERRMLFPVRLVEFQTLMDWECFDADTGKDSAREIREYFIPDFSRWKHRDSYQKAFDRLLRDLKADEARAQEA